VAKAGTLVGLGVHATKVVAAVLDAETGQLQWFRVSGDVSEAAALCAGLPGPVRASYDAGPTGYGPCTRARAARRGVRGRGAEEDPARVGRARQDRSARRQAPGQVREALAATAAAFDALGSTGWADRARSELERVGGRRPARAAS
jgi:hypothetical protein